MFERIGLIRYPASIGAYDDVFEAVLDAGAENLDLGEEGYEAASTVDSFGAVRDYLGQKYGDPLEAKVVWRPTTLASCDEEAAQSLFKLIDVLEDNDDVQNVYSNAEISDDILKKVDGLECPLLSASWASIQACAPPGGALWDTQGNCLTHVAHGVAKSDSQDALASRLSQIYQELLKIIETYRPQEAAVEETFVNKNPVSTPQTRHGPRNCSLSPPLKPA